MRREILDAAAELLFAGGVRAITFDRVAGAAGASRTTLYKWWPTPGALASEAFFEHVRLDLHFPETDDPIGDIRRQLRAFVKLLTREPAGRVLRELIGMAQADPKLRAALAEKYSRPRRDEAIRALRRAQQGGRMRSTLDPGALVSQLWGACYQYVMVLDEDVPDTLLDQLVDNALQPG